MYLIKAKTSLTPAFNNYLQAAPGGRKCWYLHSNQGGEYMGCKFQDLLCANSVTHVPVSLHVPELNRVAKRFNCMVLTMVWAYLAESNVKEELWGEALYMAVHMLNCTRDAMTMETLFEHWFGKPATLVHVCVFGC